MVTLGRCMTKTEAFFLLNIQEDYSVEEAVDSYLEKCFEIRQFIFRTPLVLKLAGKRAQQLLKLHEAILLLVAIHEVPASTSQAFQNQLKNYEEEFTYFIDTRTVHVDFKVTTEMVPTELIEAFEREEAKWKLHFSSVYTGDWLAFFLQKWVLTEFKFYEHFLHLFADKVKENQAAKQIDKLPTPQLKILVKELVTNNLQAEQLDQLSAEIQRMQKALQLGI